MKVQHIVEEETELCVVCLKRKAGRFTVYNYASKYIPVCIDCEREKADGMTWKSHLLNDWTKGGV